MKEKKRKQNKIVDYETQESIERYCEVVTSVVKQLTKQNFNFSTGEHNKTLENKEDPYD